MGANQETSAPDANDLAAIRSVITQWEAGQMHPWTSVPTRQLAEAELSQTVKTAVDRQYDELKRAVGTDEWINGSSTYRSLATQMEGLRREIPEVVHTGWAAEVLSVEFVTFEDDGDVVVRVRAWECHRGLHLDEMDAQGNPTAFVYDETPVYLYTVREVSDPSTGASEWKLVAVETEEVSLDADRTVSGPETPHQNMPADQAY